MCSLTIKRENYYLLPTLSPFVLSPFGVIFIFMFIIIIIVVVVVGIFGAAIAINYII